MSWADRGQEKVILVDASVFITLSNVDCAEILRDLEGEIYIPVSVISEIRSPPAERFVEEAVNTWAHSDPILKNRTVLDELDERVADAASRLGADEEDEFGGDIALLAAAMGLGDVVVVTDDKPLRKTCKALSIPVSGSIGVLVRAVERGDLEADVAKDKLYAMDEVGARLSASLIRRAEKMITEAADE